jgi:ribonuclease BN (tRNA processing enzyme)
MASNKNEGSPAPRGDDLLVTGGGLSLTFIGTGSAFSKKLFQNNLLIAKGAEHVLVDCGSRTPEALDLLGLSVVKVGTYLITHTHADHVGGLEEVMLVNRYFAKKKPRMIVTDRLRTLLWNHSLKGGAAWNERHDGKELGFHDFWIQEKPKRVRGGERELSSIRLGDLEIHLFRTKHIPDSALGWQDSLTSYGLVIDGRILFTSDTRNDPELLPWAMATFPIETIFHDVQMFSGGVHAGIDELATLPAATKARTWLMHYGDKGLEAADRVRDLGFAGLAEQWKTYRF